MAGIGVVFLDASAIIYLLEGDAVTQGAARRVVSDLRSGDGDRPLAVSALSRLECRVHPLREDDKQTLARYDEFFGAPGLLTIPLDEGVIDIATELRAGHGLKTPDALQAASAMVVTGSAHFVTGDMDFASIPRLEVHRILPAP